MEMCPFVFADSVRISGTLRRWVSGTDQLVWKMFEQHGSPYHNLYFHVTNGPQRIVPASALGTEHLLFPARPARLRLCTPRALKGMAAAAAAGGRGNKRKAGAAAPPAPKSAAEVVLVAPYVALALLFL